MELHIPIIIQLKLYFVLLILLTYSSNSCANLNGLQELVRRSSDILTARRVGVSLLFCFCKCFAQKRTYVGQLIVKHFG